MTLEEIQTNINKPLRKATLVLLVNGREVLLAMKKRGFGVGRWNGVGGKLNDGEDIESAAIREAEEEIGVKISDLTKVAVFDFYFPNFETGEISGQQVHVFVSKKWKGDPVETEEMKPRWFKIKEIPYAEMWQDDELWMPGVFKGKKYTGSFVFGENDKITEYTLASESELVS
jgi:8-oxo-dGTP pyrophosphatase MutT (NUDIX family)